MPLPFVIDQDKTYDITGTKQVWVSQPSTGLDKRQATLQLCIRAGGEQNQCAKKVVSDSRGLADFAIGLVNSVFNLPDGQVMFFEEFE